MTNITGSTLDACELKLLTRPAKSGREAPTSPAVAIPSGGSLLVGLAPLSLGRQWQLATGEVAT